MAGTPNDRRGPLREEAWQPEETATDPSVEGELRYVTGKGWVTLGDGVVRGLGEDRENAAQPPVDDRDVDTPPGSPATGYRVIVGGSPTGAFVGHADEIAQWSGSAWVFTTPQHGTVTYVRDENEPYKQTAGSTPWAWPPVDTGTGGLPSPDQIGQLLYSATSGSFTNEIPVTTEDGFIVTTDDGFIVTV